MRRCHGHGNSILKRTLTKQNKSSEIWFWPLIILFFCSSIFRLAVILIESCCLEKNCNFQYCFLHPPQPAYVDSIFGMGLLCRKNIKYSICEEREDNDDSRIDISCTDYVCHGTRKSKRLRKLDFTYQTVSTSEIPTYELILKLKICRDLPLNIYGVSEFFFQCNFIYFLFIEVLIFVFA